jgi:hypothetical protein
MVTREGRGGKVESTALQMSFLFAILWGLCATITAENKKKFDIHFRQLKN